MTVQAIAKILINPFFAVFFFLFLLLLKRRCHKGHLLFFTLFLFAVSVPVPAKIIGKAWSVADTLESGKTYDYAVILSGIVDWDWYRSEEKKPQLRCYPRLGGNDVRILSGVNFLQAGRVRQLLIGELIYQQVNEAEILSDFLMCQGIESTKFVTYGPVNNTLEEAQEVRKFSEKHNTPSILLITSEGHMRRAAALFRKQGLSPALYSASRSSRNIGLTDFVPSWNGMAANQKMLYELVGYAGYFFLGKI